MKEENKGAKENKKNSSITRQVVELIAVIAVALLVFFLIGQFILLDAKVRSNYMEGTLKENNSVLACRLSYTFSEPQRGDVVVVKDPVAQAQGEKTEYVKRIIGLPGETITIKEGKIYIDNSTTPLEETYLIGEWTEYNDKLTYTVPEGSYFVLGDNRNVAYDSRTWSATAVSEGVAKDTSEAQQYTYVTKKQISGKVFLRYWPLNKIKMVK